MKEPNQQPATLGKSMQSPTQADRDAIAEDYFGGLPYQPYPVQEEALLAWFTQDDGVLVCAPTGTGKTLIAEAAVYEALRTGRQCYYTTPLIALSDQKLIELQQSAVRWGFSPDQIGLVTGNRRVNPDAPVLVVVAEILLNRLLHQEAFSFDQCSSVVMDEFHSFNDPERGVVWELTLGLLPKSVRLLLLSATIGNSYDFCSWLRRSHGRSLQLVQGTERKVPLAFYWVDDAYLDEHLEKIADGDEDHRRTPGLVFCFNRDQCWQIADLLKGKKLIDKTRQATLSDRLQNYDLSQGAGPKLKAILQRGIGIHHAGILPKYRRIVEELFQEKLLSVAVCTETLSAGINLPARCVVLPTILKGPQSKRTLIEASSAHQIFGRAGRPQYDSQGFVYALAHEDDVKYLRWKEKFDSIPEDTKDPGLLRAKKQLKKKMPKRNPAVTYWSATDFQKLKDAPATNLSSRGDLPWRLLAYLLIQSDDVSRIAELVGKRLLPSKEIEQAQQRLNRRLIALWEAGHVTLDPLPTPIDGSASNALKTTEAAKNQSSAPEQPVSLFGQTLSIPAHPTETEHANQSEPANDSESIEEEGDNDLGDDDEADESRSQLESLATSDVRYDYKTYVPKRASVTPTTELLLQYRSVNPIYGMFLAKLLVMADEKERVEAIESLLQLPPNVAKAVRVPPPEELPFGPLANNYLHPILLDQGLATQSELLGKRPEDEEENDPSPESGVGGRRPRRIFQEPPPRPLTLGTKLLRLFRNDHPNVLDVQAEGVWVVGELIEFNFDFNKWILARSLQKQEGILFRHVLRFILLCDEFASVPPADSTPDDWEGWFDSLSERLIECCRQVDPSCTDEVLENSLGQDELLVGKPKRVPRML